MPDKVEKITVALATGVMMKVKSGKVKRALVILRQRI